MTAKQPKLRRTRLSEDGGGAAGRNAAGLTEEIQILRALLKANIKLGEGQTASSALKQAVDKMVRDGKLKL